MKKILVNILCSFIPNKLKRDNLRKKLMKDKYYELEIKIEELRRQIIPFKPENYIFNGKNNKLFIWDNNKNIYVETTKVIPGLNITINGDNNLIRIGCPEIIQGLNIILDGSSHFVSIGKHTENYEGFIRNATIYLADFTGLGGCEFIIGDNVRINKNVLFVVTEHNNKCIIGNCCRFAEDSIVFAADGHSVVDKDTKELLNRANKTLVIGDYCWIGFRAFLTKNASLAHHTIVGAMGVVTKRFDQPYSIVAGNPAKIVKTGVERINCMPDEYEILKKNNKL